MQTCGCQPEASAGIVDLQSECQLNQVLLLGQSTGSRFSFLPTIISTTDDHPLAATANRPCIRSRCTTSASKWSLMPLMRDFNDLTDSEDVSQQRPEALTSDVVEKVDQCSSQPFPQRTPASAAVPCVIFIDLGALLKLSGRR